MRFSNCRARHDGARAGGRIAAPLRLRTKASAKVLKNSKRFRDILDRVAMDEAETLRSIGGDALAEVFLCAYAAADLFEILTPATAAAVRVRLARDLPLVQSAPSIVPDELPAFRGGAAGSSRCRSARPPRKGAGRKPVGVG
jgi:hypothetical protein